MCSFSPIVQAIIGPSCDIATAFAVNKSRDLQVPLLGYHSVAKSASRYDYCVELITCLHIFLSAYD